MTEPRLVHNPLLAWRAIEGEVVIISPEDSVVHELNATASFVWMQANGERTPEEIAVLLAAEYEVAPEEALADTRELVAHLEAKRLLLSSPAAEGSRHG
ncbi:MAG: PqqD family protein [Acidobacteria bacterium]|nr:PqqD family protein [Acidobacteriota bacterium]